MDAAEVVVSLTVSPQGLIRTARVVAKHLTALANDLEIIAGIPADLAVPGLGETVHYMQQGRCYCENATIKERGKPPEDYYATLVTAGGLSAYHVVLDVRYGYWEPGRPYGHRENTWHPVTACGNAG